MILLPYELRYLWCEKRDSIMARSRRDGKYMRMNRFKFYTEDVSRLRSDWLQIIRNTDGSDGQDNTLTEP
jgi:hypothetical protein